MAELLAPAGSKEALIAAVEAGANAVYLAGNQFGARAYASNFDRETLRWAVRFAHLRNVLVHVTVNTIVRDDELPALAEYLCFLYEAGVDAILVQDLGVAKLAREVVPNLPLHASTQMTIHNLAGVQAMEKLGFTRVVLSRELSLKEIRYIAQHTKLEIEVFMHGALCICYSGQCLMSSMIGGRSSNRGRCAQPCRLPYTLVNEKGEDVLGGEAGKYLLSPKDLNTLELLPQLLAAGVASLKIEGRMKRPEYVATVVRIYRAALDRALADGADYHALPAEKDHLTQIFNRDFTTAYLVHRPGRAMMSDRRPNNRGLLAGRVVRCDRKNHRVTLKLAQPLALGDQLDFWVKVGGRVTATIQELYDAKGQAISQGEAGQEVSFALSGKVHEHDRAFKVYDAALMEKARAYYTHGSPLRRVPLSARVTAETGQPLRIFLTDVDGNTASAQTEFLAEPARKRPLTRETVAKQIERLGSSVFSLEDLTTEITGEVMVPVSEINEARRKAVAELSEKRLAKFRRPPLARVAIPEEETTEQKPHRGKSAVAELIVAADTYEQAQAAYEAGADGVLFGGDSYRHQLLRASDYEAVWKLAEQKLRNIYFATPRIARECDLKYFVELFPALEDTPPDELYVGNIGLWEFARERVSFPLHIDYSLIAFNHLTLDFWREQGAAGVTLSPELTLEQVRELAMRSKVPLECLVHGPLELMVSEYCTMGSFLGGAGEKRCTMPCQKGHFSLRDRKDIDFPLVTDQFCHMHVLNSRPLSMLPHAAEFAPMGVARLRIEGKALAPERIAELVRAYRSVMRMSAAELSEAAEEIAAIEGKTVTRGHYFRGVE